MKIFNKKITLKKLIKAPINLFNSYIKIPIRLRKNEIFVSKFMKKQFKQKKVLGIFDFNKSVGALGDIIMFLECLQVVSKIVGTDNISICIKNYDYVKDRRPYDWKLNLFQGFSLLKLDEILIFKNESFFNDFLKNRENEFEIWPPDDNVILYDFSIIQKYKKEGNDVPSLKVPDEVKTDIYDFYNRNIFPSMPIIVNVRNNKYRNSIRNSKIKEYYNFFRRYENDRRFKFIIICNKEEWPTEFNKLSNVFFSKNYFDTVIYDWGLVDTAYVGLFPGSGMLAFSHFAKTPSIGFGHFDKDVSNSPFSGNKLVRLNYMTKYQYLFDNQNHKFMISKFEKLIAQLKHDNQNNTLLKSKFVRKRIGVKF